MAMRSILSAMFCLAALSCCGRSKSTSPSTSASTLPLVVRSIMPVGEGSEALYLNQDLTVTFSAPIDPLRVTVDNFKVLDADGHPVGGEITVGTTSLTFKPRPPVSPSLDDGSFVPGGEYRLIVVGYPHLDGIKSTSGKLLDYCVSRRFRAVTRTPGVSPLLPVGTGIELFTLDVSPEWPLRMAADESVLRLHFTLPVLPTSVTAKAFQVQRMIVGSGVEQLIPVRVSVLAGLPERGGYPGCTVELEFDPALDIRPVDLIFVLLSRDENALLDYRGRRVQASDDASNYLVAVDPGDRVHIIDRQFKDLQLIQRNVACHGFETRSGRAVPRVWREAGTGRLGWFRPTRDVVLTREFFGLPPGADFEFMGVEIPPGVTVTLSATDPVVIRVCDSLSIRGQLIIDAPRSTRQWQQGARVTASQLLEGSTVAIVAGGDLQLGGVIRHAHDGAGSPLTMFVAGALDLSGRLPAGCVFARSGARPPQGAAEGPVMLNCEMQPGPATANMVAAEAWTEWLRLPAGHPRQLDVEAVDLRGALQLAVQIAPSHPVDPSLPHDDPGVLQQPVQLPLGVPLEVPDGAWLRFRLQAYVGSGPLPSVEGIAVLAH